MSNLPIDHQRNEQPANDAGYAALMAVKPGERLREARNARKLDLEAAAQQMNLSVSVLRALEHDDYRALPSSTFIKGYIRSYARMLRLPPDDLVRAFEYQTGVHSSMDEQHPLPEKAARKGPSRALLLVALLVLAGVIYLLFFTGEDAADNESAPAEAVSETSETAPASDAGQEADADSRQLIEPPVIETRDEPLPQTRAAPEQPQAALNAAESVAAELSSAELSSPELSSPQPTATAMPKPKMADPDVAETEAAPAAGNLPEPASGFESAAAGVLRMTFSDDCWVEIRNQQGKLIHGDLHRAGSVLEKTLTEPFEVKLGNGNAVQLSYNGDPVAFAPSKRTSVARLSFGQ